MRRLSVDALRGIVILLMALDHAQFFWSAQGLSNDGLGGYAPAYSSAFHQFTRFLSHICAPTFLFLAGMMMVGKTGRKDLKIRALLLIVLQFTLENLAWWPKAYLGHGYGYFGILACIGVSMLIITALSRRGPSFILALSLLSFAVAQAVPVVIPAMNPVLQAFAIILYVPSLDPAYPMSSLFPILHWFGFMGLGYFFGSKTHERELAPYRLKLLPAGALLICSALAVRLLNDFGNRIHWNGRPFGSLFFIVSKYPPSLVYILFTLGVMAILFAIAIHFESGLKSGFARPLVVFGQTSLFFYLAHLFLYGSVAYYLDRNVQVDLYRTWQVWLLGLVLLLPLCETYRRWKQRFPASVLRYF